MTTKIEMKKIDAPIPVNDIANLLKARMADISEMFCASDWEPLIPLLIWNTVQKKTELYCFSSGSNVSKKELDSLYRVALFINRWVDGDGNILPLDEWAAAPGRCFQGKGKNMDLFTKKTTKQIQKIIESIGGKSIETLIYQHLFLMKASDPFWRCISRTYRRQFALISKGGISLEKGNDEKWVKAWYKDQSQYWGRGNLKVFKSWIQAHESKILKYKV